MLNHFPSDSNGSFNFRENRLLQVRLEESTPNDGMDEDLEMIGEWDPDRRNERLNENFRQFEDRIDMLEATSVEHEIRNRRNMFRQMVSAFKDSGLDRQSSRQLAAELSDALSDNPDFMNRFGENGLRTPRNFFDSMRIENGQFELSGDESFELSLDQLRSDRYNQLRGEYETATQTVTSEATEAELQYHSEIEGFEPIRPPFRGETVPPAATNAEPQADGLYPPIETSTENLPILILNTENEIDQQISDIVDQYNPSTSEFWSDAYMQLGERLGYEANPDHIQTNNGVQILTQEGLDTFVEGLRSNPEILAEITRTIAEQTPEQPTETIAATPSESFFAVSEERLEAMETDSESYHEYLEASLSGAIENIDQYTAFDLPEELQEHYNEETLRLLFNSGRIHRSDRLIDGLDRLGIDLDQLDDLLEFRRGNLENGRGINAENFLNNTPYGNEDLSTFFEATQDLLQRQDELTEVEQQELLSRIAHYRTLNEVVGILTSMEIVDVQAEGVEELDLNPDNIRRVNFSREIRERISSYIPEMLGMIGRHDNNQEKLLMALYVYLYGPLERILNEGGITVERFRENAPVQNNRRENQFQLEVTALPEARIEELANAYREFGLDLRGLEGRETNLTDAFQTIVRSEQYDDIREYAREQRLERLGANPEEEALVFHHLRQVFDIQFAGTYRRRGRGTLSDIDYMGGAAPEGENYTDFLGEQLSDNSMYHYIASEMGLELHPENMTINNLTRTLNRYLSIGAATAGIVNPSLRQENPDLYEAITNAETLTVTNLDQPSFNFNNGQIDAIRYGVLFETQLEDARARALEVAGEEMDNPVYAEMAEYWASNPNIPNEAIPVLARQSFGLLTSIDLTEGIENGRLGVGGVLNLRLSAYLDDQGEWRVAYGLPDEARSYISFQAGNTFEMDRQVNPGSLIEGMGVALEVGRRFDQGGSIETGFGGGAYGFVAYIGATSPEGRRGWSFEVGGGANTLGGFVRAGARRSLEGVLNTNVEQAMEASEFGEIFMEDGEYNTELLRSIVNGQVSRERLLELANRSETLSNQLDQAREAILSNPELSDIHGQIDQIVEDAKVNFINSLSIAILNAGVEGVGLHLSRIGVAVAIGPPFIIPYLDITTGGNRRFYPGGLSDSQGRNRSDMLMMEDFAEMMAEQYPDQAITVGAEGSSVSIDADGNYSALELIVPNGEFVSELEARQNSLEALNEQTETTGLEFIQYADGGWGFRVGTRNLSEYGLGHTTEILIDRYSGLQVTPTEETGEFRIQWGSSPDTPPPGDLVMARQDTIDNSGANPAHTVISLSRGTYTPSEEIRNNPMGNPTIFIAENGNVEVLDGSDSFDRQFTDLERPEIEVADYEYSDILDPARRSAEMFTASNNLLESLRFDTESLNEDFDRAALDEMLADEGFIRELADRTTVDEDGRPDYNNVAELIQERLGRTPSDGELHYLLSRLMPSTYLTVERIDNVDERMNEVVRVATEVTEQMVREVAAEIEYEGDLEALVAAINQIGEESYRNNEQLRAALEQTPIETTRLTQALEGNQDITTVFTVAAWRNMDTRGLRQLIFTPGENSPEVVANSTEALGEDQEIIAEFLNQLYQPDIEGLDVNAEGFYNSEEFREAMLSQAAVQLLSIPLDINETGERLSLISFMIGDPALVEYVNTVMNTLRSGETNIGTPSEDQLRVLRFLASNIQNIINAGVNTTEIQLTDPDDPEFQLNIPISTAAGTTLVYPCANLSFYYDRQIGAEGEIILPEEYRIVSGRSSYMAPGSLGQSAMSTAFTLGTAVMFGLPTPPSPEEPGKEDTPAYQEEDVETNAEGEQYIPETTPGQTEQENDNQTLY